MRRSIVRYCLVGALAVSASAAAVFAQSKLNVKLGLWQITTTMQGTPPGDPQPMCITAEKLASGAFDDPSGAQCKHTITGQTSTTMDVNMSCTNTEQQISGTNTLHLQVLTPTSVKGTLATKTSVAGRALPAMNGTFTGKFVSDKCGDLK